jgi:putative PIN family toxin of toxin-antitoxin system
MRLLVDNNVFVSALINPNGKPAMVVDAVLDGRVSLVTSIDQIERLADVFARPKFLRWFSAEQSAELLRSILHIAEVVEPRRDVTASPDPEDNLILGAALAGAADYLVTGDKDDLLQLLQIETTKIVPVSAALRLLSEFAE